MTKLLALIKRNIKVYFSDKSMFFTSLVTPAILLILYSTFLGNVFRDTFKGVIPPGISISNKVFDLLVSGQILSSLLAVSCITVSFTSNLLMVQDKVNGSIKDINITGVNKYLISIGYFIASFISTIIVNMVALMLCLIYTYTKGWTYNFSEILVLSFDVVLLTLFGCGLSSVINFMLKSQGQVSAVGTIVSAGYGFICGAYMPISSFSKGLQKVLSFFPGTYGTSLIKNHALHKGFKELSKNNVPAQVITELKKALDCNIKFYNHTVTTKDIYIILFITVLILLNIFILQNIMKKEK